jgi:Spy/CpxP family protein refolding chaperone
MRTPVKILAGALAATLSATVLVAQPGFRDRGPGPDPERIEMLLDHRADQVAEALELDATQRAAFDELRATRLERARPKLEALRTTGEELRALLDGGSTDATAVGEKVLALHALKQQLRAERESFERDFARLLSDEQRFAWEALRRARSDRDGERPFGHGFDRRGGWRGPGAGDDDR